MFDGVHRGHAATLRTLRAWAAEGDVDSVVLTFDQHPRKVLTGVGPPLLTSLAHRQVLLERQGVTGVVVLPFNLDKAR